MGHELLCGGIIPVLGEAASTSETELWGPIPVEQGSPPSSRLQVTVGILTLVRETTKCQAVRSDITPTVTL